MSSLNEQLFAAIESGNVDEVDVLLKKGASINAKDEEFTKYRHRPERTLF